MQILYEDNHCLAVVKPARLPTAGDESGEPSLLDLVRESLRTRYHKPGNVFVGLVHRLDRPVSGVVLFARTSKGASRLAEQFRAGTVAKRYHAIVEGAPAQPSGELVHWLIKNEARNLVRSVPPATPNARESRLRYSLLASRSHRALLEVEPLTGRSHQIRVQLATSGCPIVGDLKYGAHTPFDDAIALHAAQLTFTPPTRPAPITVSAPWPQAWSQFNIPEPAPPSGSST